MDTLHQEQARQDRPVNAETTPQPSKRIAAETLRTICLDAGASAAGFVEIGREALAHEKDDILRAYPRTKTLVPVIFAMNPENIRSLARQVSSAEFHTCGEELSSISRTVVKRLNALGIRALMTNQDFPMDMGRFPGKIWDVSHKLVAVEAGLGHMGINRLVLHPELGNFLRLGTILIDAEVDEPGTPLPESPCIRCGLCASVCPVGAVSMDKPFDFMACMTHAYRDNVGGFLDMIDSVLTSKDLAAFRQRFRDNETASMWQSLMYKMNYRCGYCMAVCPVGQEPSCGYVSRKKEYLREVVLPLKNRDEQVYVAAGTAAQARAESNPHKDVRVVPVHLVRKS